MSYKLPYQPTAETLARINVMLKLIAAVRRPMMGGDITQRFAMLRDVTVYVALRIKMVCFRAGFLHKDYVPFTGNCHNYTMTDKGLRFLDLAEKRNALVAWREVMSEKEGD